MGNYFILNKRWHTSISYTKPVVKSLIAQDMVPPTELKSFCGINMEERTNNLGSKVTAALELIVERPSMPQEVHRMEPTYNFGDTMVELTRSSNTTGARRGSITPKAITVLT